jgi:hypothetical protein
MANIDAFKKDALGLGGARANLFQISVTPPNGVNTALDMRLLEFTCKGGSLPGSVIAQIDVPYRGRQLKVAGDRTFENYTITVFNEDAGGIRNAFERWMQGINQHASNIGVKDPAAYQADITIRQLDRNNTVTKTYVLSDAFPVNLGAIELSYDANDAIEEFTVEFAYQYWTSTDSNIAS